MSHGLGESFAFITDAVELGLIPPEKLLGQINEQESDSKSSSPPSSDSDSDSSVDVSTTRRISMSRSNDGDSRPASKASSKWAGVKGSLEFINNVKSQSSEVSRRASNRRNAGSDRRTFAASTDDGDVDGHANAESHSQSGRSSADRFSLETRGSIRRGNSASSASKSDDLRRMAPRPDSNDDDGNEDGSYKQLKRTASSSRRPRSLGGELKGSTELFDKVKAASRSAERTQRSNSAERPMESGEATRTEIEPAPLERSNNGGSIPIDSASQSRAGEQAYVASATAAPVEAPKRTKGPTSKWTGVKGSMDFVNKTKALTGERRGRTPSRRINISSSDSQEDQESKEPSGGDEATAPSSCRTRASSSSASGDRRKAKSKWAGVKGSVEFINKAKTALRNEEKTNCPPEKQATNGQKDSVAGDEGRGPFSSIIESNDKTAVVEEGPPKEIDTVSEHTKSAHKNSEVEIGAVPVSEVSSGVQKEGASDEVRDASSGDSIVTVASKWSGLKGSMVNELTAKGRGEEESADQDQNKDNGKQKKQSKWGGLRGGIDFISKTKKQAEDNTEPRKDSESSGKDDSIFGSAHGTTKWAGVKGSMDFINRTKSKRKKDKVPKRGLGDLPGYGNFVSTRGGFDVDDLDSDAKLDESLEQVTEIETGQSTLGNESRDNVVNSHSANFDEGKVEQASTLNVAENSPSEQAGTSKKKANKWSIAARLKKKDKQQEEEAGAAESIQHVDDAGENSEDAAQLDQKREQIHDSEESFALFTRSGEPSDGVSRRSAFSKLALPSQRGFDPSSEIPIPRQGPASRSMKDAAQLDQKREQIHDSEESLAFFTRSGEPGDGVSRRSAFSKLALPSQRGFDPSSGIPIPRQGPASRSMKDVAEIQNDVSPSLTDGVEKEAVSESSGVQALSGSTKQISIPVDGTGSLLVGSGRKEESPFTGRIHTGEAIHTSSPSERDEPLHEEMSEASDSVEDNGISFLSPLQCVQLNIGPEQVVGDVLGISVHGLFEGTTVDDGIEVHHMERHGTEKHLCKEVFSHESNSTTSDQDADRVVNIELAEAISSFSDKVELCEIKGREINQPKVGQRTAESSRNDSCGNKQDSTKSPEVKGEGDSDCAANIFDLIEASMVASKNDQDSRTQEKKQIFAASKSYGGVAAVALDTDVQEDVDDVSIESFSLEKASASSPQRDVNMGQERKPHHMDKSRFDPDEEALQDEDDYGKAGFQLATVAEEGSLMPSDNLMEESYSSDLGADHHRTDQVNSITKEYTRLAKELEESKARTRISRNEVRVLQQEIQRQRLLYGEVERRRQLSMGSLERRKIVLKRVNQ